MVEYLTSEEPGVVSVISKCVLFQMNISSFQYESGSRNSFSMQSYGKRGSGRDLPLDIPMSYSMPVAVHSVPST